MDSDERTGTFTALFPENRADIMQSGPVWGFGSVQFIAKAEPLYDAGRQETTTDISGLIKTTCQSGLLRHAAVCRALYDTIRDGRCDLTHKNRINNESKKSFMKCLNPFGLEMHFWRLRAPHIIPKANGETFVCVCLRARI